MEEQHTPKAKRQPYETIRDFNTELINRDMKYRTVVNLPDIPKGSVFEKLDIPGKPGTQQYSCTIGGRRHYFKDETIEDYLGWFEPIEEPVKIAIHGITHNRTKGQHSDFIGCYSFTVWYYQECPDFSNEAIERAINMNHEQKEGWTVEKMREVLVRGDWYSTEERIQINNFITHLSTLQPSGNPEQPETLMHILTGFHYFIDSNTNGMDRIATAKEFLESRNK